MNNLRGFGSMSIMTALLALGMVANAVADGGAEHQVRLSRPIPLGVSGGSAVDRDGAFCCGGTLGAVVQDCAGAQYVLSNNHVLGRTNRATPGEDVVQPGLIDSRCSSSAADVVADFTELIPISFDSPNTVDAAIAQVRTGAVSATGSQRDIGAVSAQTVEPAVLISVQKDGRTSGHTVGTVSTVDVTVLVSYPKKCGGGGGPAAQMDHQFRISPADFSTSGDSGSVIYESGTNPRAVGLLFAGSSTSTIASPMSNVLGAPWSVGPLAMAGGSPTGCGGCTTDAECADADACTIDTCGSSGACEHTAVSCDDGNACTDDLCQDGACTTSPINCNDNDVCTADSCDVASGCLNTPEPGCVNPCGDGTCAIDAGENCVNCPDDCNGLTRGKKSERYCCGADTDCSDPRCTDTKACIAGGSVPAVPPHGLSLAAVKAIKARHSPALLAIEDVVGHGIGVGDDGQPVIEVFLARRNPAARAAIPRAIEGIGVRVEVTGPFTAF